MLSQAPIDPAGFVASVKPLLEKRDPAALLGHLRRNWTPEQITSLLSCRDADARKVAALALSLVGSSCCIPPLLERLKDPDSMTNQLAENALWSIWFRAGPPEANACLAQGARFLAARDYRAATAAFNRAIELAPAFAEAYHQRGIAWYLLEDYDRSAADCQRATQLMPCHFGAWSGLGHCHAHRGRVIEAIKCYRRALEINPHLHGIRQAVEEISAHLARLGG